MDIITRKEELIMLAIWKLQGNAYGVTIIKEVQNKTGKKLTFGSLWVSLDILFKRGLVHKRLADPTPERGGRSKIYYTVTSTGLEALEQAKAFQSEIWRGVPALIKKAKEAT